MRRTRDSFFSSGPSLSTQLHGGSPPRRSPNKSSPTRWNFQGCDFNELKGDDIAIMPLTLDRSTTDCNNATFISCDASSESTASGQPILTEHAGSNGTNDTLESTDHTGEFSRQEDEYDFAILLKASKFEERLHISIEDTEIPKNSGSVQVQQQPSTKVSDSIDSALDASGFTKSNKKKPTLTGRELLVHRIRRTGLEVKRLLSLDGKQTLLKVKAPPHVLERGAERMRMRKVRRFDRIWMEFSRDLRETFIAFDGHAVRFIDSEKQSIVHSLLTSPVDDLGVGKQEFTSGAGLNEACPLRAKYVVQMYPLHKHDLGVLRLQWVTYWRQSSSMQTVMTSGEAQTDKNGNSQEPLTKSSSTADKFACGRLLHHALDQPIDHVAQYFGEKVAFYFAWTEMYTRWLVIPSIAGSVLFALQVYSQKLDHPAAPLYSLFMALWTSAFLLAWQRQAARLSYRWGTLGYEEAETTRPEYYGDRIKGNVNATVGNPKNDNMNLSYEPTFERHYPAWKRYIKYCVTVPSVVLCIVSVVLLAFLAFSTRDRLAQQALATRLAASHVAKGVAAELAHGTLTLENLKQLADLGMNANFWFYLLITPVLYGLLIPVFDVAFTTLARRLNDWENHETETQYQSHLILKVFSFRFVHVFASLYYYAFSSASSSSNDSTSSTNNRTDDVDATRADSLLRVAIQLASFMVTGQLWKHVSETLIPYIQRRMRAQQRRRTANAQFSRSTVFNVPSGPMAFSRNDGGDHGINTAGINMAAWLQLPQQNNALVHEQCVRLEQASDHAWEEAALPTYDTFHDYTELLLQFGYVSFFSLAFPLAPVLALANNVFELRANAFKLCHAKQRPIARKASGIGIWFPVLQLMSVLAVLTNCLNIALTTTLIERLSSTITASDKVWMIFGVEHALLALKGWMQVVIPTTPRDIQEKVRLEREHVKRESARAIASKT